MIGSHNSFTHLPATSDFMNRLTFLWRCQNKTVVEQYEAGVRYFDVRVKSIEYKGRKVWRVAHGSANLNKIFMSLTAICSYFKKALPGATFRLLLEDADGEAEFREALQPILNNPTYTDIMVFAAIKKDWQIIFANPETPRIVDYCYVPWHSDWGFWENIKNFEPSTIKKWAEEHNPVITQEMIEDPNVIYFMDFV